MAESCPRRPQRGSGEQGEQGGSGGEQGVGGGGEVWVLRHQEPPPPPPPGAFPGRGGGAGWGQLALVSFLSFDQWGGFKAGLC